MITLEVNGVRYEGFTEIIASKTLVSLSGAYSFAATSDNKINLPIKIGDECRVLIADEPVNTGFIETVDVGYDARSHSIAIQGRDKTMDVIDSSVVGVQEITGKITLAQLIRRVLDGNGLTEIDVIDEVPNLAAFTSTDIQSAEIGDTVFEFIEKYSRKRQVLLTTDGNGNIVITRTSNNRTLTNLVNITDGDNNNILSATVSYSETALFSEYTVRSQLNVIGLNNAGEVSNIDIVDQSGIAIDADVRDTRLIVINPENANASDDAGNFAIWSKNIRRARSFIYNVTVQGHHQDKAKTRLWIPNEIIRVQDDFTGINAELLINTVTYGESLESGTTTVLSLVDKDVYTLQSEQDARDARANEVGAGIL